MIPSPVLVRAPHGGHINKSGSYCVFYVILPPSPPPQFWANDKETASLTACQSLGFAQPEGHREPRNKVGFPTPDEYTLFYKQLFYNERQAQTSKKLSKS